MAFTKFPIDDELLFGIPELDTHEFENYYGFSKYLAVGPFGPRYIYDTTRHLISISLYITTILGSEYTVASLVRYCINSLSRRNRPVDIKKLSKFFLFKPDNTVMKTLEATTQLGGFNKLLLIRQSNKHFPYSGTHQHEDDAIVAFFSSVKSHGGTTTVEIVFVTKTLLMDVYYIGTKSGLNIAKVLQ